MPVLAYDISEWFKTTEPNACFWVIDSTGEVKFILKRFYQKEYNGPGECVGIWPVQGAPMCTVRYTLKELYRTKELAVSSIMMDPGQHRPHQRGTRGFLWIVRGMPLFIPGKPTSAILRGPIYRHIQTS